MEEYENIPGSEMPEATNPKASPFADSPYEMNDFPEDTVSQAKPEIFCEESKPKKQSHSKKRLKTVLAGLLVVALVVTGCGITALTLNSYWRKENDRLADQFNEKLAAILDEVHSNSFTGNGNSISGTQTADGLTPGQVYAQNKKSVVAISNQVTTNIFGQISETASSGSGFILSADGYIVSNYHVVEGATTLTVITSDGDEYPATLVGHEEKNDLALLKIEATDLPFVKLGKSSDLIVGDQVVAIGNPLGELTNTLTVGYISAKERDVSTDGSSINMLQTDAAINPGNSGGPLFNMKGEVIGITTAKYSGTTSSGATIEGIGFAIPIDDVSGMIAELIENGYVSSPYMGVSISTRTDGFGVYVEKVEAGTPAAKAGIRAGDIIVGLGDYEISTLSELDKALRNFKAHETTTIHVYRNRSVLELTITFTEKNQAPTQKT